MRLILVFLLTGCATTTLTDCTIEISRSDPARDALKCRDHVPIALINVNPALRRYLLNYGGAP